MPLPGPARLGAMQYVWCNKHLKEQVWVPLKLWWRYKLLGGQLASLAQDRSSLSQLKEVYKGERLVHQPAFQRLVCFADCAFMHSPPQMAAWSVETQGTPSRLSLANLRVSVEIRYYCCTAQCGSAEVSHAASRPRSYVVRSFRVSPHHVRPLIHGGQVYGGDESVGVSQRRAQRPGDPGRYAQGLLPVCRVLGEGVCTWCVWMT